MMNIDQKIIEVIVYEEASNVKEILKTTIPIGTDTIQVLYKNKAGETKMHRISKTEYERTLERFNK